MSEHLVTLDEAKTRLKVGDVDDADLRAMILAAQTIVLDRISQRRSDEGSPTWADTVAAWDAQTVPADIKAAILMQCAELDLFRGDDDKLPTRQPGRLTGLIEAIVIRYGDPAVS